MTKFLTGFGNHFESEAVPGALIKGRNSPKKVPFDLYAEQLSGTAFTMARQNNLRSWLYRIRPSVLQGEFVPCMHATLSGVPESDVHTPPNPLRWNPMPYPEGNVNFIESLFTFAGNGAIAAQTGACMHLYCANQSMKNEFFYNADGDFLVVPQEGNVTFRTEFGELDAAPGEIVLLPRGIKYQVELRDKYARGYICENFGAPFRLPELGVIGANGLANARDFLAPTAAYEARTGDFTLLCKFNGKLWQASIGHSPLDVVAWHGTYVPYKYNLSAFNAINSVSHDHSDPSIFTVLTSPSEINGVANVDFVIFPPRWMVAQETFRPPYFHRNIMSELMGLIRGRYEAKELNFIPGSISLHNCMSAHGPDAEAYYNGIAHPGTPEYCGNCLAFMFESRHVWRLTEQAYHAAFLQKGYQACWKDLNAHFALQTG